LLKDAATTGAAAFKNGVWVGRMRTRLAVPGYETKGPQTAAKELLKLISSRAKSFHHETGG